MQPVHAVRRPQQALLAALVLGDRIGVEQLAQLGFAEELAQLRLIDRERLRAAFGERRVTVVDEVRDIRKQE